jgi:hypothetical protein
MSDQDQGTVTRKHLPGLGSIYLRGRTWHVEYWRNNVQHRESSHSDQERKAIKLLRQRRDEMARDEFIRPKANKVTMKDLFDAVVADYARRDNRSSHTLAHRLKPLRKFFDNIRAAEVTERMLERYKAERLAAGRTKATTNRELAVIRRAYKLATRGKDKLVSPTVSRPWRCTPRTMLGRVSSSTETFWSWFGTCPVRLMTWHGLRT